MDKERTKIDQKLCDTVRMMMAGKDAKVSQVVELLGISQATVNRIRQAGYSLEQFNKDKSSRNERKKELKEQRAEDARTIIGKYITAENAKKANIPTREQLEAALAPGAGLERALAAANQIEGQMEMDLQPAEEQKPEMSEQTKLMRFLAGKFNEVDTTVQVTQAEILLRIGKIEDYLAQILRRMDR